MESKTDMMSSLMEDLPRWPTNKTPTRLSTSSRDLAGLSPPLSCVTRETSQEDCARHRFIVWAAVKRNTCPRMSPDKRLECPLLRCTRRFIDHESMLTHLAGCEHLSTGEYWCYDHQRVECFDDVKCKRCLGHPSKRRKMMSMAKNFFHSLGHKSKKAHQGYEPLDEEVMEPPPRYESIARPTELSSTEILEIDSTEVTSAPAGEADRDAIDPQALLVPELDSTTLQPGSFMQWQPTPLVSTPSFPIALPEYNESRPGLNKPTLQLNTHGLQGIHSAARPAPRPRPAAPVASRSTKGLSPSSSVRSTASTDSNVSSTSNVSSLISPVSNWSGAWSMADGINTNLTSPIDAVSPSRLLPDSNPFADTGPYNDPCPNFLHSFYSELPADPAPQELPDGMRSDHLLLTFDAPAAADFSYATNIVLTEDSANVVDLAEPDVEESNTCCSQTKSLIGSAWDALQEHIVSSMLKIQNVGGNPLADQLRTMSTRTIAASGLKTLRALLDGAPPSSAIDTLCFIHLMYAFSLVVHEQGAASKSKDLFLWSLSHSMSLSANERDLYTQLVYGIWQPADITQTDITAHFSVASNGSLSRSSSLKGKAPENLGPDHANALLVVARNFLNELECSVVLGQPPFSPEIQASDLYMKHLMDFSPSPSVDSPFYITVNYILNMLVREFSDVTALANKLYGIKQRVGSGTLCSVRKVEIELLQAGKGSLSSERFFDSFAPAVRKVCDPIYEQHDAGTSRRNVYHGLGITLIESIIPEFDNTDSKTAAPAPEEDEDLDQFFREFTTTNYSNSAAPPYSPMTALPYDAALDTAGLADLDQDLLIPIMPTTPADTPSEPLLPSPPSSQYSQHPTPAASSPHHDPPQQQQESARDANGQKIEAHSCCEICGYRPKGDPQWFKGSMAKHKKLQHSTAPPKIYKCPFPGCSSAYKNRPDNLRQHQIEKRHFVGGDTGDETAPRRPTKRKKITEEDE